MGRTKLAVWQKALLVVAGTAILAVSGYKIGTYYLEQRLGEELSEAIRSSQIEQVRSALGPDLSVDGGVMTVRSTGDGSSSRPSSELTLLSSLPITLSIPAARPTALPTASGSILRAATPASGPPLPDLAIVSLTLTPANPVRGQPVAASIKGANRGAVTAEKIPVRVDLEYEVLGKWVPIIGVWGSVDTLAPGSEITMQRTAAVPAQLAGGRYRVIASVDPDGKIVPFNPAGEGRRSLEFSIY